MALSGSFNSTVYGSNLNSSPGFQREYGTLSTSVTEVSGISLHTSLVASSADLDTYIWGLNITTSSLTGAVGGALQDSDGTELIGGIATANGPFFQSLDQPVKVSRGKRVDFNVLVGAGTGNERITVFYFVGAGT